MATEETNGVEEKENAEKVNEISEGSEEEQESSRESRAEREAREKREAEEREFRAKKRKLIPPFVMLLAGAITSISMRLMHYETKTMLIILLCVLLGFYIAGCFIKLMLDKFEAQIEEANMDEGEVIEKELAEEDVLGKSLNTNKKGE